jgi:hypothetical protein
MTEVRVKSRDLGAARNGLANQFHALLIPPTLRAKDPQEMERISRIRMSRENPAIEIFRFVQSASLLMPHRLDQRLLEGSGMHRRG